jgi:hypothetical protein
VGETRLAIAVWTNALWVSTAFYGSAALVLMAVSVLAIRRLGLWASRERVVQDRPADRRRRTRTVWSNPVAWREVKTIAVHRRMRWARILSLVFCLLFSSIVWVGWVADWLDNRRALSLDIEQVSAVIACTASVAWVLMALLGSVSFSYEREHSTLDNLLASPLSAAQIVLGKLRGIARSSGTISCAADRRLERRVHRSGLPREAERLGANGREGGWLRLFCARHAPN